MRRLSPADTFRSGAHRNVENILHEMNVNFESEVGFHPYRVDIYLPEWHVVVEVDGPQHSPRKDLVRDQTLEIAYRLPVLHIKTGRLKKEIIQALTAFFETHADSAEERKLHARQSPA